MSECTPPRPSLLTIGHSDHDTAEFIALLLKHGVQVVADVRSSPYSRFHAQFNRDTLAAALKHAGIEYVFLGRELGARRTEPECYRNGQARYDLISRLPAFREGLERIRHGVVRQRIVLLCAEKDPITCHRTVLVCRQLRSEPMEILHILGDGSIETTDQAEMRLLEAAGLPPGDLFRSRAQLIEEAYDLQAERIAYTESEAAGAATGSPV